ncbi:hypothetical protein [Lentilactobacillus sp. SPB1-3]|uniref:Uncharacterized protein n=1 Tax=Lentilactobacillus terminaliae TaxID=3003483 RepID=A0ACD5DE71_9LACO|nr:hypothetical protein [Lentilactobacillus sp. SPB1-3]MCZ0977455.1 hypothetical protein [Lentilactobacillus sp. SPB1-3]
MKKVILWSTIVLGMLGILMTGTMTANAATWHNGVPSFLKAGFWKANKPKNSYIKFSSLAIYYSVKDKSDDADELALFGEVFTNPRFKKSGTLYVIDNRTSEAQHTISTVRRISRNKATFHLNEKYGPHINTHITRITKLP